MTDPIRSRTGLLVAMVFVALPAVLDAQAPAPGPNLAVIRRNASISEIDRQNIQRWVDGQMDPLFAPYAPEVIGMQMRTAVMEHFQATDATPAFRGVLAASVANSLMQRYPGSTSLIDTNLPRPLPVAYALTLLNNLDDPAALPVLRRALLDNSSPPAPGIAVIAAHGLTRLRERIDAQAWTAILTDAQKLAAGQVGPVLLSAIYRMVAADTPEARAQQGVTATLAILEGRLNRFEQNGWLPSVADREAATWLGTRALATQNTQVVSQIARQLGRLLADAAFAYSDPQTPPARQENLERVIIAAEQALSGIANAKAPGRARPNVTGVLLSPEANKAPRLAAEVGKWIGTPEAPGLLNGAPFNLPVGLDIRRVAPVATAAAPAAP